jgi:anti-sigma factor RsiW
VGLLEASCTATAEAISDRIDGELRGLRRLRVSRHLARCTRCHATLASLARLVQALRTLPSEQTAEAHTVIEQALMRIRKGSGVDGES